jgi:hypothetical protein
MLFDYASHQVSKLTGWQRIQFSAVAIEITGMHIAVAPWWGASAS